MSINLTEFFSILNDFKNYTNDNYDLNSNNCTDSCLSTLKENNINLPDSYGSWPFGGGSNPGALGEDLKEMDLSSNMTLDSNGGETPSNEGTCP